MERERADAAQQGLGPQIAFWLGLVGGESGRTSGRQVREHRDLHVEQRRLKAGDRVIGRANPRVRLAAGQTAVRGIDVQIPQLHGTGSFKLVAELLPYAVSGSTGGSRDANVSVSPDAYVVN